MIYIGVGIVEEYELWKWDRGLSINELRSISVENFPPNPQSSKFIQL